ncbi:MAG TPA: signal peptidase II [Nocardioides sp.]|nr:signal peptidase II [Nocardioides sp.]
MQAARGTSLSDEHTTSGTSRPTGGSSRFRWVLATAALLAYAVDVATKQLAVTRLEDGDVAVLGDWFVLHLTYNPGAAFSLGTDFTVALTFLAIAAVCVIVALARKVGSTTWAVALGLLLGGVAGNLTDRLLREPGPFRGHVVDLFMVPNWPVFNVADVCINVAAALIVLQAFRGVTLAGGREKAPRR